ncbi:MAG: hypothetical protein Q4G65_02295 [bacterium]|nr:hypothetical protein [bacterium]
MVLDGMMKCSWCVCLSLAVAAWASADVLDLDVAAGTTSTLNAASHPNGALLRTVAVNGTLVVDGISVTNSFAAGAAEGTPSLSIGCDPSATTTARLLVTNAPGGLIGGYVNQLTTVIGANGGQGGLIDLHARNPKDWGWGVNATWGNGIGKIFTGNSGTFGAPNAHLRVDASVQNPGNGILDILRLGPNSAFAGNRIQNESTSVRARILFAGGRLWTGSSNSSAFFDLPSAGQCIELASVDGNDIVLYSLTGIKLLTDGNKGTLSTSGAGSFVIGRGDNTVLAVGLPSGIAWGHAGETYLAGRYQFKILGDDALPYGRATRDVWLGQRLMNNAYDPKYPCYLDLNGKTVRVNGLHLGADRLATADFTYVTNGVSTGATVIFGDRREGEDADPDGVFEVNNVAGRVAAPRITWRKVGSGTLTMRKVARLPNFTLAGGTLALASPTVFGTLALEAGTSLVADGLTLDLASLTEQTADLTVDSTVRYGGVNGGMVVVPNADGTVDVFASSGTISPAALARPVHRLVKTGAGVLRLEAECEIDKVEVLSGALIFADAIYDVGCLEVAEDAAVTVSAGKLRVEEIADATEARVNLVDGGVLVRKIDGIVYPFFETDFSDERNISDAVFTRYSGPGNVSGTFTGLDAVLAEAVDAVVVKRGTGTLQVTSSIARFRGDLIVEEGVYFTDCEGGLGGDGARVFIRDGATMIADGTKETLDLRSGGQLYIAGTGAPGKGYALEMRSPGKKTAVDLRVTSETGFLRYVGSKGLTLTDDATVTITKSTGDYYTGRLGTIDFRGHALTFMQVANSPFPELTFDTLRPVNPGSLVLGSYVKLALTSLHEDLRKGGAGNRISRLGEGNWQLYNTTTYATCPWSFEMGGNSYFQFEANRPLTNPRTATWGGPLVLSGSIQVKKISTAINGSTERNQNYLQFTNRVTGAGGFVNSLTTADKNYQGGGICLSNPGNDFAGPVQLNAGELILDCDGALPAGGAGARLRNGRVTLAAGVAYTLPGCEIFGTGTISNGEGKWTKRFVKHEEGELVYQSRVDFAELEVLGGTLRFDADPAPVSIDRLVVTNSVRGAIDFAGRTCHLGGLLVRGAQLNASAAPITVDGKLVFAEGSTLAIAEEGGLRSNGSPVKIATAVGGIEGLPVVADPRADRSYRLYVDGNDLLLDCSSGTLLIFR